MYFWQIKAEKYKTPKSHQILLNGKDHRSQFIHGNQRFTILTDSDIFSFFLIPPSFHPLNMTKAGGCTGIYRCYVFGIWVKVHQAG